MFGCTTVIIKPQALVDLDTNFTFKYRAKAPLSLIVIVFKSQMLRAFCFGGKIYIFVLHGCKNVKESKYHIQERNIMYYNFIIRI